MAGGVMVALIGVWALVQIFGGQALQRLRLVGTA